MTVVDCTAPLNRYTCYGAIEVVAIIIYLTFFNLPRPTAATATATTATA